MDTSWNTVVHDATDLRRRLHQHPEIGWSETWTATTIRDQLDRLGVAWRVCAGTGTVATLAAGATGRHVALRADIDAMPVHEATGAAWTSQIDGMMHACGHDGHTATLLAVARWLREHEATLPGPATLLFQPAEEGGHGARGMVDDGALDGVDVVFGWHNWPAIPFGQAVCPDGTVMCGNGTFEVLVEGVGGHASQPEATRDPVLAAAAVTVAVQQVVSRRLPPQRPTVVAVTSIDAPSAATVTPASARLGGSIRIADEAARDEVQALIDEVVHHTAAGHGCRAQVVHQRRYGPTVNHPGPAAEMRGALADELGDGWHAGSTPVPIMASEDFSYYLAEVPGAFALVGAGERDDGDDASCHSPHYDFNDRLIAPVARIYARLAGAPLPVPTSTDRSRT